jgi:hypothetical protein
MTKKIYIIHRIKYSAKINLKTKYLIITHLKINYYLLLFIR